MGPIQSYGPMTHSLPSPSRVSRFTTRLLWRWQHAIGWRIEGPFPNAQEPRLLILGPGLVEGSLWVRLHANVRRRKQCVCGYPRVRGCVTGGWIRVGWIEGGRRTGLPRSKLVHGGAEPSLDSCSSNATGVVDQ